MSRFDKRRSTCARETRHTGGAVDDDQPRVAQRADDPAVDDRAAVEHTAAVAVHEHATACHARERADLVRTQAGSAHGGNSGGAMFLPA
jgi:hypothetical protein